MAASEKNKPADIQGTAKEGQAAPELLGGQLRKLSDRLEAMQLAEYIALLQNPWRLIWLNFLAGMAKGLGAAVGATLIFALMLNILSNLLVLNLPIISDWIAQIIALVEKKQSAL